MVKITSYHQKGNHYKHSTMVINKTLHKNGSCNDITKTHQHKIIESKIKFQETKQDSPESLLEEKMW